MPFEPFLTEGWAGPADWPDGLRRAAVAAAAYRAGVRRLGVVEFEYAEDAGPGWVRLVPGDGRPAIEVRLKDLRWVADVPAGNG